MNFDILVKGKYILNSQKEKAVFEIIWQAVPLPQPDIINMYSMLLLLVKLRERSICISEDKIIRTEMSIYVKV